MSKERNDRRSQIDYELLKALEAALQKDHRFTYRSLAKQIGRYRQTVSDHLNRLLKEEIVIGVKLNWEKSDREKFFISVKLRDWENSTLEEFERRIKNEREVIACDKISSETIDYLVTALARPESSGANDKDEIADRIQAYPVTNGARPLLPSKRGGQKRVEIPNRELELFFNI